MKFRTEIEIAPLADRIGYQHRLLAIGSCFAEHIAAKLTEAKFRIATNPTGILFNPLSIAEALHSYAKCEPVRQEELQYDGELWFHYGFHGSFADTDAARALERMNTGRKVGAAALETADFCCSLSARHGSTNETDVQSPTATGNPPRSSSVAGSRSKKSSQRSTCCSTDRWRTSGSY